jgi:hypothetical protein
MTQTPAPTPDKKKYWQAVYVLFQKFALDDQRNYYRLAVKRYRKASSQVNLLRAIFALITGASSALAGLIVALYMTQGTDGTTCVAAAEAFCPALRYLVVFLAITAVVAPAVGAAFTTLADLYQWDRLTSIYDSALDNLEVADAQSPFLGMGELKYRAALRAYAEGALDVMKDETAQWGQIAKPPQRLDKFIADEIEKARNAGGAATPLEDTPTPPPTPPPALPEEPSGGNAGG